MDERLLLIVNQGWANPALDGFFAWISSHRAFSLPLFLVMSIFLLWRFGLDGIKFCLLTVLFIALGEQLGVVLKEFFEQARPCAELGDRVRQVNTRFPVSCSYSLNGMPSNHALEYSLLAVYTSVILRWRVWAVGFLFVAVLVSLSRVYLGLHYPSQILAGAVIGSATGGMAAYLSAKYLAVIMRIRQTAR